MEKLKWITHADLAIERNASVGRREYLDHMTFRHNERALFTEIFGPIVGLKEEWEEQGASVAELDFSAFKYRCERRGQIPAHTGRVGGVEPEVLEETDDFIISRDELGRTVKLAKGVSTLALLMDHPVKNMDDWLRIKPWYQFSEARFERDWQAIAQRYREEDRVLCVSMPGGFDEPRQLLGEEELYVSYYTQPELIHDVLDTIGHTAVQVFDRVASEVQVDLLRVHEDMAERAGPLAGPKQVDEFIKPYYRRVWDRIQERGAQLFDQDSDGDMSSVIPSFLAAGINYMHPVEPVDNMDIVELRAQYGQRLAFYGGLDKHVLREGKEAIAAELEHKMPPLIKSGGCVLALDHRIPNGTPLENYRFYIEKSWEIIERES
ncbi:MAG: uroporphyrinogen decarboxylase family protein [Candidatus Latescibacterota bacterium]|jgi:hypothetical protein